MRLVIVSEHTVCLCTMHTRQVVKYGKLLIATGASPLKLRATPTSSTSDAISTGCYCLEHSDMRLLKIDSAAADVYGHGSAHYLRDIGDVHKLVKALATPADNDDEVSQTCVLAHASLIQLPSSKSDSCLLSIHQHDSPSVSQVVFCVCFVHLWYS